MTDLPTLASRCEREEPSRELDASRALAINDAMVAAWLIQNDLKEGPAPDVRWFSPMEAAQASEMVRDTDIGKHHENGRTTLACFVAPSRVDHVYAYALRARAAQEAEGG